MSQTKTSRGRLYRRVWHIYALTTGTIGLIILIRLFVEQRTPIDLATLLAFTLTALIVSYFKIPIDRNRGELALDGTILLGATLVGGPALGGWSAFITGLVTSIVPFPVQTAPTKRWDTTTSSALLNGGRNVIATAAAWWAYQGVEGNATPTIIDTKQALAIIVLCIAYAGIRALWLWPIPLFQDRPNRPHWTTLFNLTSFLAELLPLPIASLTAAIFVKLGWSFFLLFAFALIGLGAVMRQMLETMHGMQIRIDALEIDGQIRAALANTPKSANALSDLAHDLAKQLVPASKHELGIYNSEQTHVHILISSDAEETLPPMYIPLTPQWEWMAMCMEPRLFHSAAQMEQLPFSLPPIAKEKRSQSAMFVPIPKPSCTAGEENSTAPAAPHIGGIAVFSLQPAAFTTKDLTRIATLATQIGTAIAAVQHVPACEPTSDDACSGK